MFHRSCVVVLQKQHCQDDERLLQVLLRPCETVANHTLKRRSFRKDKGYLTESKKSPSSNGEDGPSDNDPAERWLLMSSWWSAVHSKK